MFEKTRLAFHLFIDNRSPESRSDKLPLFYHCFQCLTPHIPKSDNQHTEIRQGDSFRSFQFQGIHRRIIRDQFLSRQLRPVKNMYFDIQRTDFFCKKIDQFFRIGIHIKP